MEGIKFEKVTFGSFLKSIMNNQYLKESIQLIVKGIYGSDTEANMTEYIKVDIYDKITLPERKTESSAGYDFLVPYYLFNIPPNKKVMFPTGIKAKMPSNVCLKLYIRSSLGTKYDLEIANGTGIVDADYYNNEENEGNIGICIRNTNKLPYIITENCCLAQGIFEEYFTTEDDNAYGKRKGGFGSTTK